MIESYNPATSELIEQYNEMTNEEIANILTTAQKAFHHWREIKFDERSSKMYKAGELLETKKDKLAALITLEMGKPITQSKSEIEKCALVCKYYADNAEGFLSNEFIKTDYSKSYVAYNPLGVILGVMPWNFPFWQVFRFAVPTLMAGNAVILKHSSNVSGCALAIEELFHQAGFHEGLFRTIILSSSNIRSVIENPVIKAVSLTGSTEAGKSIAGIAGSTLKKSVLELGGSDPYIILADADLEYASTVCVNARLINSGQSCIAAKRFIVVKEVYDNFTKMFVDKMYAKKMGDPFSEEVEVGPQAREDLRYKLQGQVSNSVKSGAEILLGGEIPDLIGAYYPPTVLSNVSKGMPAYEEELFGPVAAIIKAKDEKDAIKIANDTSFGLGSAIFSKDQKRAEDIAAFDIEAGSCFVNDNVKSDPRLPFGGIKESGFGRELATIGIKEFVNIKTIVVK